MDLDGAILLTREKLALLMNKEKRGELTEMPELVKVADIIDQGEEMPKEMVDIPEEDFQELIEELDSGSGCSSC